MISPRRSFKDIFNDETNSIKYLIDRDIIRQPTSCLKCCGISFSLHRKNWRCCVKSCRKEVSIFDSTFFENMKLKVNDFMELAYYWLVGVKTLNLITITGHSSQTITNYCHSLRKMVSDSLGFEDIVIGGENIVVEIDESKFGKIKHNRGHSVNGAWVLGGVERTTERKMFLLEVPDRAAETLIRKIKTYVKPGSIIITDCFKSYATLHNFYTHLTVNHSIEYVDSVSGAHTNTIEGTWGAIKYRISPRNRTASVSEDGNISMDGINEFLGEFQWRRKNHSDLWNGFMDSLKNYLQYDNFE